MSTKTAATILLSSLLYTTTYAFVPLHHIAPPIDNNHLQPTPSEINPAHGAPLATPAPITNTPSIATQTPAPSTQELEYHILPLGLDAAVPDLKVRQVTGQAAGAALPTEVGQVSPVTTYLANKEIAPGSFGQVPVVYTQTFIPFPDPWPSAAAGTIGLGTIQGTVGGVRSKRSEPTQAPMADVSEVAQGRYAYLSSLEVEGKKVAAESEVSASAATTTTTGGAIFIAPAPTPITMVEYGNDARRAFQAGSLAMLAVGIATMCATYL